MSSRWYPLYKAGNPQLRIFLPNFWMKIVRWPEKHPPNVVYFETSVQMTDYDVRNYLQKIYKIEIADVKTEIKMGKIRQCAGHYKYIVKDDDYKIATVTLPKDKIFEFPDVCIENKSVESDKKQLNEAKKEYVKSLRRNHGRPGVPSWFTI